MSEELIRDITALADGSLAPERRAAVEARLEQSPELREALAEQRRAVETVRAAASSTEAPAGLRSRIEADRARLAPRRRRRHLSLAAGFVAAAAAAALLVVLVVPPGTPGAPSVVEAASLTDEPAERGAPAVDGHTPALLDESVEGVPYPNWEGKFDWPATGRRDDELGGRDATTVFYERDGKRIGYTIVSGSSLRPPRGSRRTPYRGIEFHEFEQDGRLVVTWLRDGRTCVMAGEGGIKRQILLDLAAWKGKGSVSF